MAPSCSGDRATVPGHPRGPAVVIALENYRSRFNAALGPRREDFSDQGELRPVT